eukprot:5095480-Amphidinium_carterae.1
MSSKTLSPSILRKVRPITDSKARQLGSNALQFRKQRILSCSQNDLLAKWHSKVKTFLVSAVEVCMHWDYLDTEKCYTERTIASKMTESKRIQVLLFRVVK